MRMDMRRGGDPSYGVSQRTGNPWLCRLLIKNNSAVVATCGYNLPEALALDLLQEKYYDNDGVCS